jgi:hypothetical protein
MKFPSSSNSRPFDNEAEPPSALGWWLRFALAFWLLNTLLTFKNRWPGFGVAYPPRLSFWLCLAVLARMGWVTWRGHLSSQFVTAAAVGFVALVLVRHAASPRQPCWAVRPVNMHWDGRHASEWLWAAAQALPSRQVAATASLLVVGPLFLMGLARWAIQALGECLAWERPRPSMLTGAGALKLSFAAYVPDQRDTRWFLSLPLAPTRRADTGHPDQWPLCGVGAGDGVHLWRFVLAFSRGAAGWCRHHRPVPSTTCC